VAGGGDADVAGFFPKLREGAGAEVAKAALHAAGELQDDGVERGTDFFEGFDA